MENSAQNCHINLCMNSLMKLSHHYQSHFPSFQNLINIARYVEIQNHWKHLPQNKSPQPAARVTETTEATMFMLIIFFVVVILYCWKNWYRNSLSYLVFPGTEFMVRLQEHLKYFVVEKITNDPLWQGPKVYLSGHEVCMSSVLTFHQHEQFNTASQLFLFVCN